MKQEGADRVVGSNDLVVGRDEVSEIVEEGTTSGATTISSNKLPKLVHGLQVMSSFTRLILFNNEYLLNVSLFLLNVVESHTS